MNGNKPQKEEKQMKTIRHETQEDFFARMTLLAQKLDRGEQVETGESASFEDLDEMNSYKTEQDRFALLSPPIGLCVFWAM
ncbi:hypothetical protein [Pseudomonas sp. B22129]|uniref:hypothetical protein n=1 Tax=Pseudomonas sp. B22129 TaxID=3235111 RepID=UPI003783C0C9